MTDAAIKALIAHGVANALAEYEAHRSSGNGNDSHESGSGRRTERAAHECTYINFLKCQPLNFKVPKGVIWHAMENIEEEISTAQELVLMCSRKFPEESNEVEKYVGGLPDMI
ncbi:hypothetical protein Tco_0112296 [Tanacetum coccineum]